MKEFENVNSSVLRGTNANEPPFAGTTQWLDRQLGSGKWEETPPVISLQQGEEQWVVDGNHRRDFAKSHSLPIPRVISIESDGDIQALQEQGLLRMAFSKVKTVSQLHSLLERRLK